MTRRLFPIHALTVGDQLVCGKFDPAPDSTPALPSHPPISQDYKTSQPGYQKEASIAAQYSQAS
jgi:hypothetical protein